jgi:hypothetical protein
MIQYWFIDVWCWQWRYCIRLENLGDLTVQLRERHWRIFSLSGTLETVRGRGVVGQEPVLSSSLPAFQYSSHVSLQAPSGHMWWDIYILNLSVFVRVHVQSCATGDGHWAGILCKMQVVAAICVWYYAVIWLCSYMQSTDYVLYLLLTLWLRNFRKNYDCFF